MPIITPDGRYIVVNGRLWRASNPHLPEEERRQLVSQLMQARRAVGTALKGKNAPALKQARAAVQKAKVALGERGLPWWPETEGPDYNRHLVKNTPYIEWFNSQ
ncbi:MAG TPA: hypothetical protein VHP58_04875 [Alphaproteobacteria bacterium]|nr:hypothetical protein [Alphaproteobacteria bacterium]